MSAAVSIRSGAFRPEVRDQKAGDAERFKILQRLRQIEDRLGPGSDDGDRGFSQFAQVGGDVETGFGPPVDPPDPAGGKDMDPGEVGADHRGGHGGGSDAAGRKAGGKVRTGKLGDGLGLPEGVKLHVGEAHMDATVHDRDGGGDGALRADLGLDPAGCFHILREWHAVGDDRAFKRNNGRTIGASLGHFGREGEGQINHEASDLWQGRRCSRESRP